MKVFHTKKNASLIRYFAPILTVAMITVTATISVWYLIFESERHSLAQEFAGRARNQTNILQNRIEDYWEKLYAVRALFDSANQPITREEFERFSNSLLAGHSAMLNVAWIPRVTREERVAHEISAVRDGLNDYRIRTITEDGKLVIAPDQDEYFPKFYSTEPRTSRVYGLDNNDGAARLRAVHHIRDENVLSTSPPLMLLIGEGDRRGFWAGLPVYARGLPHETVEDRRRNFIGFIQGVFQIRVLIDTVLAGLNTPVRLYLFAPDAGADDPPVYYSSRLNQGSIAASSQAELAAGMHQSFALNFGDVPWTLIVTPEPGGLVSSGHDRSSIVLIAGLLLSGILISFMWASRRQAVKLEIANDKFAKQNLRFDAALNNMAQGLLMYDRAGKLIVFNRRFTELFGVPREKWERTAPGMTVSQSMQLAHDLTSITEKYPTQVIAELQNILDRRTAGRIIVERTDGRTFSAFCAPMSDGGFVVTFDDITEQRRTQEQISHMAHYDSLTNLPNRVLFYEKMESILARTSQNKGFAVFSLDLDHFKSVNDTLGHPVGDQLLQAAAKRMHSCVRENDVVARLGGDEFAIVLTRFDQPADATSLAKRLIETVSAPYQLGDHQVMVGTSIGIAIAPGDGAEPDLLMKNADLALYRCKADGGNTYRFFEPQMDARMQARRALELDLRKALVNGEFTLDYQPIVNLKTGRVSTCEALIRWHQPERGLVPPLEFIPIAEETGLIVPIGEWVLRRACADAAEWPGEFTVAVNVSPAQFKSSQLVNAVMKALETSHLPASRLELEITELVLMQDNNTVLDTLHQLRDLGVSIAMDDFGTGYSSLSYLRSFPFDKIKIDQSFIEDLAGNKDSLAILRAVVGIGRSLGIVTTAEGIESQNQLEVLRTEGCTEAQGYFFSRPKSAGDIKDFLCQLDRPARAIA
jgi:diguanylate cyclase (GGDEF)-like protein/PAS domain S-box-containing protein